MRILLNKGKLPESFSRVLPEAIVDKFITKVEGLPYNNTRAYGFDTACPSGKMTNCFRHDGSTGIMAVADKDTKIVITVLTNRGHPDVNNNKFEAYKGKIADTIMTILGY
jgi:CubicO group peptidase (beta-lactamase class C family)